MSGEREGAARILAVDDDPAALALLVDLLSGRSYAVETARDAEEAWARLTSGGRRVDVVLLDWLLPGMDGLALLRLVKHDAALQTIPVIFATALADRDTIVAGISAGAYYHVTKPLDPEMLLSIVGTAVEDHARYQRLQERIQRGIAAFGTLEEGLFRFRTLAQAAALAQLLSRACPDPERTVVGLDELLVNAVEHGNLGIGYEEKSRFLAEGGWEDEVERRLALPENRGKSVEVRFERRPGEIVITIADEGPGFDWTRFLTVAPERVFHTHGRGIAMARSLSFDRLEFRTPGNCVEAAVLLRGRA